MRKVPSAIIMALLLALLAACSDSSSSPKDVTTAVSLSVTERDLDAEAGEYVKKTIDELYWTYTAEKTDGSFATGETTEATPLRTDDDGNALTGIPDSFGKFSYGLWEFQLEAYYIDDLGEVDYYTSEPTSVTISSKNKLVEINVTLVEASGSETGSLCIYSLLVYLKDADPDTDAPADISESELLTLRYVLDGDDSTDDSEEWVTANEMSDDEGLTIDGLTPGYHPLSIYLVTTYELEALEGLEDIVASAVVEDPGVYIRPNVTSTVSGYLQEGTTRSIMIESITEAGIEYLTDGSTTEVLTQVYPDVFTAADGEEDFGDIGVTASKAGVGGSWYDLTDYTFEYTLDSVTYTVTLDLSTATYSSIIKYITYTADDEADDLGSFILQDDELTHEDDDTVTYTIEDSSFTYETENVVYTVTLNDPDDHTYTYSTQIVSETFSAGSTTDFGDIVVYSGTSATISSVDGLEATLSDDGESYSVTYETTYVIYTITLDRTDYSYTVKIYQETYTAAEGAEALGTIIVIDETTAVVNGDSDNSCAVSGYVAIYTPDSSLAYEITFDTTDYTYTTVLAVTYTAGDDAVSFGSIIVTAGSSAKVNDDVYTLEEDGTLTYTSGQVTYSISFEDSYTYTTSVISITYTADSAAEDLGSIVEDCASMTAVVNSTELEVTDGVVVYTSGSYTYTITLNEDYTYSTVVTVTYTAADDAVDIGSVAVTGGYAIVADSDESIVVTTSGTFIYTSGSAQYQVTLNDDLTYSTVVTVTYIAADGAEDLGSIYVTSDGSVAVEDDAEAYELEDDGTLLYTSGALTYTVTFSDETYTTEVSYITYTAGEDAYDLGDIVLDVNDSTAAVGSSTVEVSDSVLTYTSGRYSYEVTLEDGYTYSTVRSTIYTASSSAADLGDILVTDGYATVGTTSGLAVSSNKITYSDPDNPVVYVITLTSVYTYTTEATITYSADEDSEDFGSIVVTGGSAATVGDDTATYYLDSDGALDYSVGAVTYLVTFNSDYTYTTEVDYITYTVASGYDTVGSIVVKGTSATIRNTTWEVVDGTTITYVPDARSYAITLDNSDYTYTTVVTTSYTADSSAADLGTIKVTGGYAVIDTVSIEVDGSSLTYELGSVTYEITLNSDYTYSTVVSATYTKDSSSEEDLGDIVVKDGVATIGGNSVEITSSTFTYNPDNTAVAHYVTLDSSSYTYTAVSCTVYSDYTSYGIGSITVVQGYADIAGESYYVGTDPETVTYAPDDNHSYLISFNNTTYTFTATLTETYYAASDELTDLGTITVTNGSAAVTGFGSFTVSDSTVSFISGSSYTITFDSDSYEYSVEKVTTYSGLYGTITETISGSSKAYVWNEDNDETYAVSSFDSSSLVFYVGYAGFQVELDSSDSTYTADNLVYVADVLCGYGDYYITFSAMGYSGSVTLYIRSTGITADYDINGDSATGVEVSVEPDGYEVNIDNMAVVTISSEDPQGATLKLDIGLTLTVTITCDKSAGTFDIDASTQSLLTLLGGEYDTSFTAKT